MTPLRVSLIGGGYWGSRIASAIRRHPSLHLAWLCDTDPVQASAQARQFKGCRSTDNVHDVLGDESTQAVVVATPAATHSDLAMMALRHNKHVLAEKPLATTLTDSRKLVEEAARRSLVLMCDHIYCYSAPIRTIRELIQSGEIGDLLYVESTRSNLGLVRQDVDVIWDLAIHDVAILDHLVLDSYPVQSVSTVVSDPLRIGRACISHITMDLGDGVAANINASWLSPVKTRLMTIAGTKKMLMWNDLDTDTRIIVYDRGVDVARQTPGMQCSLQYRNGMAFSPAMPSQDDPLANVLDQFATCIRRNLEGNGVAALRVVELLERATAGTRH